MTGEPVHLEPTPSGAPTASMIAADGRRIRLHSAYDPGAEARRFAAALPMGATTSCIVLGLGLGYHVAALAARLPAQEKILVIEHQAALSAVARNGPCARAVFGDPRIAVAVAPSPDEAHTILLQFLRDFFAHDFLLVPHAASVALAPEYYGAMEREFTTVQAMLIGDAKTRAATGARNLANSIKNLPAVQAAVSIGRLKGLAKGRPAFVVAAGPSLDGNLGALHGAAECGPILAVGTVSGLLSERGLRPDLIVTVDPNAETAAYFKGREDLRRVPLAFDIEAAPEAVAFFAGVRFLIGSDKAICRALCKAGDLSPQSREEGILPRGLSVAHYAFEIAHLLGADPIVLVGQDLAFAAERSHASGVDSCWGGRALSDVATHVEVPGNRQPRVTTNQGFLACIRHYEKRIAQVEAKVINATEGGARIRGCEIADLAAVVARYARCADVDWHSPLAAVARTASDRSAREAMTWLSRTQQQVRLLQQIAAGEPTVQTIDQVRRSPVLELLEAAMARDVIQLKRMEKAARGTVNPAQRRRMEAARTRRFLESVGRAAEVFVASATRCVADAQRR